MSNMNSANITASASPPPNCFIILLPVLIPKQKPISILHNTMIQVVQTVHPIYADMS